MTENNLASSSFLGTRWGKCRPTFAIELGSCKVLNNLYELGATYLQVFLLYM